MPLVPHASECTFLLRRQFIKLAFDRLAHAKVHQVFLHHLIVDRQRIQQLNCFVGPVFAKISVHQIKYKWHVFALESGAGGVGLGRHGGFQLSYLPNRFTLSTVFAKPLREAWEVRMAFDKQTRSHCTADCNVRQQGPVLVDSQMAVQTVTQTDKLGCFGHRLDIF